MSKEGRNIVAQKVVETSAGKTTNVSLIDVLSSLERRKVTQVETTLLERKSCLEIDKESFEVIKDLKGELEGFTEKIDMMKGQGNALKVE
ncbi:hypothetical protein V6N13_110543 [Hibiscus sabdariffa]